MKGRNPKTVAGLAAAAVLLILCAVLAVRTVPLIGRVREEMSLTPTPLPPVPDSVRAVTLNPGAPTPEPPLGEGSQGERVWALQQRLQDLGYYTDLIDGQYGPGTREAVTAFQRDHGLAADGIAGEETLRVLNTAEKEKKEE